MLGIRKEAFSVINQTAVAETLEVRIKPPLCQGHSDVPQSRNDKRILVTLK
jgi:hypothetical protein